MPEDAASRSDVRHESDIGALAQGRRAGPGRLAMLMNGPKLLLGILILFNIALNFANIVGRYFFLSPIFWAEEVMVFSMVWCIFLGAAIVAWEDSHLRMDLLSRFLPARWKVALDGVVALCTLVISAIVVVQSWEVVSLFAALGQRSASANIPLIIPQAAIPVSFALVVVVVVLKFCRPFARRKERTRIQTDTSD